mgnify:CR=1 FL=1
MRTITVQFTVPESYEADYADVVAELVMADFFDGNGFDKARVISDSAPPAGTPRAIVAASMARADAAGLNNLEACVKTHRDFLVITCDPRCWCWVAEAAVNAYALLAATYDDMLAERYEGRDKLSTWGDAAETAEQLEDDLYQAMNDLRPDDAEKAGK